MERTIKANILIIEDDEDMCTELKYVFEDEGFHVDTVFDGKSGISAVKKDSYAVVLLDIKLPGMSGFEILKIIKDHHPNIKVAILTGGPLKYLFIEGKEKSKEETSDKMNSLKLADYVINKPFNIELLVNKVKELAGKN